MTIGFTGTRHGMTDAQHATVARVFRMLAANALHHGDCIGADAQAHDIATALRLRTVAHPCDIPAMRANCEASATFAPLPPLARNDRIVAAADWLVAAPREATEQQRSGTWATVRRARKAGVPVFVVLPDGALCGPEEWEERAAIREHDGNQPRAQAEAEAAREVRARRKP